MKQHEKETTVIIAIIIMAALAIAAEFMGVPDWLIAKAEASEAQTSVNVVIQEEVSSYNVDAETGVSAIVRCNNDNWENSPRCTAIPDQHTFTMDEEGGFEIYLMSGVRVTQKNIVPGLQKFEMEDVYWYIDKHGRYDADNDFTAFIQYLTRMI